MDLKENLSRNIKTIRGFRSQGDFAKELGIGKSTLQSIENRSSSARLDTLEVLSKKLKTPVGELLSDPGETRAAEALKMLDWSVRLPDPERREIVGWLRKTADMMERLSDTLGER